MKTKFFRAFFGSWLLGVISALQLLAGNQAVADGAAPHAEPMIKLPADLVSSAHFEGTVSAAKLYRGEIYFACGTKVERFDLHRQRVHEMILSMKFEKPITAIEVDQNNLWLGCDKGLVDVSTKEGTLQMYGEKDGFPAMPVSTLNLTGFYLFVGMGNTDPTAANSDSGGFGYLDLTTGRFISSTYPSGTHIPWPKSAVVAPSVPVWSIATRDGNNLWVSSQAGFQHLDLSAQKWSLAMPEKMAQNWLVPASAIALNYKFLATPRSGSKGGINFCALPDMQWTNAYYSENFDESTVDSLAIDPINSDYLWIGGFGGKISLFDMAAYKFIAQGSLAKGADVQWIFATRDKIVFVLNALDENSCDVYCFNRSVLDEAGSPAAPSAP